MNKNYIIEGDNGNRNSDFNKFHSLSFFVQTPTQKTIKGFGNFHQFGVVKVFQV